jgi:predicted N-acyltransferase
MFTAKQQSLAPGWWPRLSAAHPVFSDARWLELFARSRGETGTWWFSAGRPERLGGPEIGLRGAVVAADTRKSMNPYRWLFERTAYHDREPFDAGGAPQRQVWFPALLCSYPGLDTYPVGANENPELVRMLLDGITKWARDQGIVTVAVGFVQPERCGFAAGAAAAGYLPLPVATRANLEMQGRSAEEVFGSYSAQQRNNLRRLRRRLASAGVRVAELPRPLARLDTLVELRCAHSRQHGKEPDAAEERAWLGQLLTWFGDRVTVYGATSGSQLRGFSLFVDDGRWWNAFAVARRDPVADRDLYFELMYHVPIEHAAQRGIAEISFGYGTEEAKRRRGCTLVRVPTWFRSAEPSVDRWLGTAARSHGL